MSVKFAGCQRLPSLTDLLMRAPSIQLKESYVRASQFLTKNKYFQPVSILLERSYGPYSKKYNSEDCQLLMIEMCLNWAASL
jgi:hypothetical protein